MRWLVSKLDHIGDFALSLPVMKGLFNNRTHVLDVVVSPWNMGWKEVIPWIGQFYSVEFPAYQHGRYPPASKWQTCRSVLGFWNEVRKNAYDAAIDLRMDQDDWRGKLVCRLSNAPVRIGSPGKGRRLLTAVSEEVGVHQSERILERVRLALPAVEPECLGIVNLGEEIIREKGRVVLHPGAGVPAKKWPFVYWVELIAKFSEEGLEQPILTGGPGDLEVLKKIASESGLSQSAVRLSASIKDTLKLFASVDVVVGLDSAAPHMAALVNTKTVSIFSATNDPRRWGALGRNEILFDDVFCSPCRLAECAQATHLCMEGISPTRVFATVLKHLGQT